MLPYVFVNGDENYESANSIIYVNVTDIIAQNLAFDEISVTKTYGDATWTVLFHAFVARFYNNRADTASPDLNEI